MNKNIKYVNGGIANNYGTHIELNKNLTKYPALHDQILSHELKHADLKFSKDDFLVDLTESSINNYQMIKFMLKNPRSFSQLLPITLKNKKIYYDINAMIVWVLMFISISLFVFIGVKIWSV